MTKSGRSESDSLQLGNLPDMVGVELRICQILTEKAFRKFSHTQVSAGVFMILSLISKNPGQKQSTLAAEVKLDRSTMVPIIDRCERQGWVERKPYEGDRRAYAIHLTTKGNRLMAKLESNILELEQTISAHMGKKNRAQLLGLLKKLQAALPA